MYEAGAFYLKTVEVLRELGWTDETFGSILDFGCGWGRIYRFFLRHCESGRLVGVDIDNECIALCRDAMPYGTFATCDSMPPLPFDEGSFDLVTAYSVFSHLAPKVFLAWVEEFGRLLRPGGVLAFTTLVGQHINVWEVQERHGNEWDKGALRHAGFDARRWRRRLALGEALFVPTGGGGVRESSFHGETVLPAKYLATVSPSLGFSLVTYTNQGLPQAFAVLRRAAN
jgi:SAM-dependent methyltransferase